MSVVVRFAPSPTGMLHAGNVRAALLNYLFTRKLGGKFILRIDDTDKERSEQLYVEHIQQDLTWLGITWDETFKQSGRLARYEQVFLKLKDEGFIYPCFESREELDLARKLQLKSGRPPIYNRAALSLSSAEIDKLERAGVTPHWRFKLADVPIAWDDMILGDIKFLSGNTSDPIIRKPDGSFVYTFASVVDDFDMNITHIIRGADHTVNTSVQMHILKAIGGENIDIKFGHYPLLRTVQGQELSKRLLTFGIKQWRESGLDYMAINSLLTKIGTSDPIEIRSNMQQLIDDFDIAKVSKAEPKFDENELYKLNHNLFINMPFHEAKERLDVAGIKGVDERFWDLVRGNLRTILDVEELYNAVYGDITVSEACDEEVINAALTLLLEKTSYYRDNWNIWIKDIKEKTQKSGKNLFMPLRICLTGMHHGPDLCDVLSVMGEDNVIKRLNNYLERVKNI